MDKCKYYLTENGTTLIFNSDAELTEFIRNSQNNKIEIREESNIPWKDDKSKLNNAVYFHLKGTDKNEEFQLKKDIEDSYYSIHFKTTLGVLSEEEKIELFEAVANYLPLGSKLSTWGNITKGGIAGLERFRNLGFKEIGTRTIKNKQGENVNIPIFEKVSSQGTFIKYSKSGDGLESEQELVLSSIINNNAGYSENFIKERQFVKEKHIIDNQTPQLLSPVFEDANYKSEAIKSLLTLPKYKSLAEDNPEAAKLMAEKDVDAELEFDQKMYKISTKVTKLMTTMIGSQGVRAKKAISNEELDSLIKLIEEYNKSIDSSFELPDIDKVRKSIRQKLSDWYTSSISNSSAMYLSDFYLNKQQTIGAFSGINSPVSILEVDNSGVTNIFEIKVSRDDFSDWHSAKILRADYKLGINRQLLENVIPANQSTKFSSLYILPVVFPTNNRGLINIDDFYIGDVVERSKSTGHKTSLLDVNGSITQKLRKLLPTKIKANPKESEDLIILIDNILKTMFPKYNFRTKIIQADAEKAANRIIENSKGTKILRKFNFISGKYIEEENTPAGQERFREKVADLFKEAAANKDSAMHNIMRNLAEAKKTGNIDSKGYTSDGFKQTFSKYLHNDWELVTNRPELLATGVLLFKNNASLVIEAVSVTVNTLDQVNNLGLGNTILGKFYKNSEFKGNDKIWNASTSHIEIIKALTVLNNIPNLLEGYSIKDIKVFDLVSGKASWSNNTENAYYNFDLLLKTISKDVNVTNNFKTKIKVATPFETIYANMLEAVKKLDNNVLTSSVNKIAKEDLSTNKDRLTYFKDLRSKLRETYPSLERLSAKRVSDLSSPEVYLDMMLSAGIAWFGGINTEFDYDVPDYGISMSDFTHMFKTWMFGSAPDYDSKNRKVVGGFQGSQFSTNDALPSEYTTRLNDIISLVQNKITKDYNKIKNSVIKVTNEMYAEVGRVKLEKLLIGNADKYHEVFFEKNGDTISSDFKLKNPWSPTVNLNSLQVKYLKKYVHFLYLYGKYANKELDTLEKFENSLEFQELMSDGRIEDILKIPLIKKQSLSALKSLTTDGFRKFIGNTYDSMINAVDFNDALGSEKEDLGQKIGAYNSVNGFGKMYNRFDSQESEEFRNSLIEQHGVGHFEVNLDTLILKYAFENLRENYFNEVLPVLDSGVQMMKFYGARTGRIEETEKALDTFFKQVQISVFNISPVQGTEAEDLLGIIKTAQQVTSFMALALRPASLIKELVVGTIKNVSFAWSKIYGEDSFNSEHLTKAYNLLISKEDYNIVTELNNNYRIANRDMNQIVDKTKVDRHGLNFFSNFLYWSNTAPDYVNRLSLFLAKMIKDGCYEAHSVDEDGNLVYDPYKDERYSYYLKMREKYNYEFKQGDDKYNDQRSLYLTHIEVFNSEIVSSSEKVLTEKDLLPDAYTNKEKESIKTFTEVAYGYYDHERSPLIKHLPLGIVFGQFMTFWPAKVKYYFGKDGTKSKRGHWNHKSDLIDGKRVKFYVKYEMGEDGNPIRLEVPETELKPGDPRAKAWEWIGDPSEGLMYSLGLVTRSLIKGESLDGLDPQRLNNAKLMLHDLLVAMIAILLGIALFSKDTGVDGIKEKSNWDEMGQYEKVAARIILRATKEFDPFALVGSIQTTPAFISKLSEATTDFKGLFAGDGDILEFFRNNISFTELIPNPMTRN